MILLVVAAVTLQGADHAQTPTYAESFNVAKQLIAWAKTDLTFSDERLVGCTITATSGKAAIDRYVCDATRRCVAEHPGNNVRQKRCLDEKLDQLAASIATVASKNSK